jgi:hypothetical protein
MTRIELVDTHCSTGPTSGLSFIGHHVDGGDRDEAQLIEEGDE